MPEIYLRRDGDTLIPVGKETWGFLVDVNPGEILKLKTVEPRSTRRNSLNKLSHLMYAQAAQQLHTFQEDQKAFLKLNIGIPVLTDPRYDDWEETMGYYSQILGGLDYTTKLARMYERHRFYLRVTSLMTDDQMFHYINDCVKYYARDENIIVLPDDRQEELASLKEAA